MARRNRRLAVAAILLAACGATAAPPASSFSPPRTALAVSSGTVPPAPSPLATSSGTTTVAASERDAWARIRNRLPQGSPVAMPTWLPSVLDRERVVVTTLSEDAADPRYVVTYSGGGRAIELGMGGIGPPDGGSGLGTRAAIARGAELPLILVQRSIGA